MLQKCSPVRPPGIIKQAPTDFVVREVHDNTVLGEVSVSDIRPRESTDQQYTLFVLTKTGAPTHTACGVIAKAFEVERWRITHSGQKDAHARTTQYIVVEGGYVPRCDDDRLRLRYIGAANRRMRLSGHQANHFAITVRTRHDVVSPVSGQFVNYFGPQRFGQGTAQVGACLIAGQTDRALQLLTRTFNGDRLRSIAEYDTVSLEAALWGPAFEDERNFMIGQWRSELWNRLVKAQYQAGVLQPDSVVPFWSPRTRNLYQDLWDCKPYRIPKKVMSRVVSGERPVFATAYHHQMTQVDVGWKHTFLLKPGVYATVFLETLYDLQDASRQSKLLTAAE